MSDHTLRDDDRVEMYYWMRLTRELDDRMVAMWRQGRGVGGTFSERGHEAVSVGAASALESDDVVAPMHRDLGCYLKRGVSPSRIFANLLGRATGVSGGRDANLHGMGDLSLGIIGFISHLPHSLPVALGAAMTMRYRLEARIALTFIGDGGSSTGLFHETLNMAAVYRAPLVVIVENNQYAFSTPLKQQMTITDIADRSAAYGIPGEIVDGNDVEAVWTVVRDAAARAREGGGPTLIEAKTMRMLGHAIHDGAEYVPSDLLASWERQDPIDRYEKVLSVAQLLDDRRIAEIHGRVSSEISEAIKFAESSPWPDPATVHVGVYAAAQDEGAAR